jgi:MFS family permease
MDAIPIEVTASLELEIPQISPATIVVSNSRTNLKFTKDAIRTSLRASTADAIFSGIFSLTTGGILLSDFLVRLDATPIAFGMLSALPMLVNLIQPLGAYLSERTTSRFQYSLLIYGTSRLVWLILPIGIVCTSKGILNYQQLIQLTLFIVLLSNLVGGLGSASWLSWLAAIVPRKLRGRYFGFRNSAASLTNLLCIPFGGMIVSYWTGGAIQGYGLVLSIGIVFGLIGIACQYFKIDIDPQVQNSHVIKLNKICENGICETSPVQFDQQIPFWRNSNFLIFLLYLGGSMLAVNLSNPFFNLYMLDNLDLPVSLVALYSSLMMSISMVSVIFWGRLADKVGNRYILILVGLLVVFQPLCWLAIGKSNFDLWVWLPMLHIFSGCTVSASDLCINNIQLEIAPMKNQSIYIGIVASVAGCCGALGTTLGGLIAQSPYFGGLVGLFVISSICRLVAIAPLFFLQEP